MIAASALLSCSRDNSITVGAKAFDEGYVLGHLAVEMLRDAGLEVDEQFGVATAAMRKGLETGQVDLYYEYTGTAYTVYAGGNDPNVMPDSAKVLAAVRAYDGAKHGLIWLEPMPFNNTYALLVNSTGPKAQGIASLSALRDAIAAGADLTIAVDAEFYERPDGLKAMLARYDFPQVTRVVKMDAGLIYTALAENEIDVGMGYSTDGRIVGLRLAELVDDLRFFPAYNPAAVVRGETLRRHPEIAAILERLNDHLTTGEILRLNARVSTGHHDPRMVAREWLLEKGLVRRRKVAEEGR